MLKLSSTESTVPETQSRWSNPPGVAPMGSDDAKNDSDGPNRKTSKSSGVLGLSRNPSLRPRDSKVEISGSTKGDLGLRAKPRLDTSVRKQLVGNFSCRIADMCSSVGRPGSRSSAEQALKYQHFTRDLIFRVQTCQTPDKFLAPFLRAVPAPAF